MAGDLAHLGLHDRLIHCRGHLDVLFRSAAHTLRTVETRCAKTLTIEVRSRCGGGGRASECHVYPPEVRFLA
jgi:hypothetical protein